MAFLVDLGEGCHPMYALEKYDLFYALYRLYVVHAVPVATVHAHLDMFISYTGSHCNMHHVFQSVAISQHGEPA